MNTLRCRGEKNLNSSKATLERLKFQTSVNQIYSAIENVSGNSWWSNTLGNPPRQPSLFFWEITTSLSAQGIKGCMEWKNVHMAMWSFERSNSASQNKVSIMFVPTEICLCASVRGKREQNVRIQLISVTFTGMSPGDIYIARQQATCYILELSIISFAFALPLHIPPAPHTCLWLLTFPRAWSQALLVCPQCTCRLAAKMLIFHITPSLLLAFCFPCKIVHYVSPPPHPLFVLPASFSSVHLAASAPSLISLTPHYGSIYILQNHHPSFSGAEVMPLCIR